MDVKNVTIVDVGRTSDVLQTNREERTSHLRNTLQDLFQTHLVLDEYV